MNNTKDIQVKEEQASLPVDINKIPKYVAFLKKETSAQVKSQDEELVMTFPYAVAMEIICFEIVTIVIVLLSLLFDAPLEEIANPTLTPNPAKAPWYFLGLQELLHYFPPVVAGVILPTLVVISLIVIM